jgi:hypothetical protein
MSRSTNTNYFRMPTDAELQKFASKLDYDNGYDMYIHDAMVESPAIKNHARTIIFAHIYGIDEVYPLTGEPIKTIHIIDGVEYEEERITKYNGRIGKYTTLRSFPSYGCFIYENGWRVGVFNEQGFNI